MVTRTATDSPRPRGRRPAAADLDMRERLLASATQLFGEQGIAATTMAQIAEAAGVTSAMVHYYFKTRDQLIDVLIDERFVPLREGLGEIFVEHRDDPVAALTALAQRFLAVGQRYPWFPPLWVRDVISEGGVLRQRMLERLGREHQEKAHTAIARWQREGRLNPALEPSLLFQSLMGLTLLPLATSQMWRGDAEKPRVGVEEIARHAVALITQGVGPGPAARIEKD